MEQQSVQEVKKTGKYKRRVFNRIAIFCNHIAVVSLLLSYLAPKVSPENFWFIAFFGIAYPFFLLANIAMVFYWLIQRKRKALYSLIVILSGWPLLHRFVQLDPVRTGQGKKTVKVMSYNVKVFDLYNWTRNKETRARMFSLIRNEAADISCFQEYFHRDSSSFSNTDSLKKLNSWPYAHVVYTTTVKRIHHWGIATFSKYPIIDTGRVDFGYAGNNICIWTDIDLGADTVRVYNMHLQSIAFSKDDYKYAKEFSEAVETEDIEHSKNILRRLKRAFVKRSHQADVIAESIAECKYPVIVCGDFNDTPSSYTYSTICRGLTDSFMESGFGFGKTYMGAFPSFRIDYILHDPRLKSYDFRTIREELSDHFPVVANIELR